MLHFLHGSKYCNGCCIFNSVLFIFQSPADLDLDGRTNGFSEVNGNPLLDATKNNFSRIVS